MFTEKMSTYPPRATVGIDGQGRTFADNAVTSPRQAGATFGVNYQQGPSLTMARGLQSGPMSPRGPSENIIPDISSSSASSAHMRSQQAKKRSRSNASRGSSSNWSHPPSLVSPLRNSEPEEDEFADVAKLKFSTKGLAIMREKIVEQYFPTFEDINVAQLFDVSQHELASIEDSESELHFLKSQS